MDHDKESPVAPEPDIGSVEDTERDSGPTTIDIGGSSWRRRLTFGMAGVTVVALGFVAYGATTASEASTADEGELVEASADAEVCEEIPLSPEEIAEINAEEDALAAFLEERGIPVTRQRQSDGIVTAVWDFEDEAANKAVDQFYAERYPMEPEEVAAANADEDALAAFLQERGIAHSRETDAYGVNLVVWDENDEAANTAVEEFWNERYPEEPLPPEEVASLNADEDALATFLDERGIRYTREPDSDGVNWVTWDENDEAANTAVEEFWSERYPEEGGMETVTCEAYFPEEG